MTSFTLKLIAMIAMVIDHTGAAFSAFTPFAFRVVGRLAFPIFVYLIAEGCTHTRNINKYMLNLGIFALISEIPFDLALTQSMMPASGIHFFQNTNVFYTLFLGVGCINFYQKLRAKNLPPFLSVLPAIPLLVLAELFQTDYGMFGVLWIFATYLAQTKKIRLLVIALGIFWLHGLSLFFYPFMLSGFLVFLVALTSLLPLVLYNGKRGRSMKWFFYCFYPGHLLTLAAILFFL